MTENHLLAEVRDKVLYITFNRPEKHNALSQQLLIDLKGIFESHSMDESIVAAVLTGSARKTQKRCTILNCRKIKFLKW